MLAVLSQDVGKMVAESVLEFEGRLFCAVMPGNCMMLPETNTGRVRLGGYTVSFLFLFLMLLPTVNACICVSFVVAAVQLRPRSLVYLRSFMRCLFLFSHATAGCASTKALLVSCRRRISLPSVIDGFAVALHTVHLSCAVEHINPMFVRLSYRGAAQAGRRGSRCAFFCSS